jgi:hypothetical protein
MKSTLGLTKTQENRYNKSPEERLFMSVISQAFQDATYTGPYRELIQYKREAVEWFQNTTKDFKLICTLSSYDWEYVSDAFKKAQKKGLTSYTEYQYKFLYGEEKPIKKDKFVLRVRDEYF